MRKNKMEKLINNERWEFKTNIDYVRGKVVAKNTHTIYNESGQILLTYTLDQEYSIPERIRSLELRSHSPYIPLI